jgi:hypothetical protein
MLERDVERRFVRGMRDLGALTLKIRAAPGWPDRLVVLPGGLVVWIELKRPGARPRPLQEYVLDGLAVMGHHAGAFDDPEKAAEYVRSIVETERVPKARRRVAGITPRSRVVPRSGSR